ncbi:MAG TPA: hypothetical protein VMV42_01000 [archaeon]|nr:hypothetical protein [archaeon]
MIAIVRWVLRHLEKEHILRTNYHKSHPHFILYLGIDAVLSGILIAGGFHFLGPSSWVAHEKFMLAHPGVIPMPLDDLLDYVNREPESIYWLGPVAGDKYTLHRAKGDGAVITYFPDGPSPANVNHPKETIETYKNLAAYKTDVHPLMGANSLKFVTSSGATVEFNKGSTYYENVTFKDKPEIVIISYPSSQLATTLIKNANNLKLVR